MKLKVISFLSIVMVSVTVLADVSAKARQQTLGDIRASFGAVPSFFEKFPAEALDGAWQEFKAVQLNPNTHIAPKYKELIGLAVAAQVPCSYCTYFHTRFAKLNGAAQREINESVAVASHTLKWSSYFAGAQVDLDTYKKDISAAATYLRGKVASEEKGKAEATAKMAITDPQSARKDIERAFGFVPEYLRTYPERGIVGAWLEKRDFIMSADTALPKKIKNLISLAVASQSGCTHCSYSDAEFARLEGASSDEIREAVVIAGIVRHWSTYLNGVRTNEREFQQEVDRLARLMEKRLASNP